VVICSKKGGRRRSLTGRRIRGVRSQAAAPSEGLSDSTKDEAAGDSGITLGTTGSEFILVSPGLVKALSDGVQLELKLRVLRVQLLLRLHQHIL
jgi:hypothetical protein